MVSDEVGRPMPNNIVMLRLACIAQEGRRASIQEIKPRIA
jgi:hypothetical protein